MQNSKLSVIIITKNEEEMIRDCLESIKWADEIVIVDSGSEDKTLAIAKKYTDKIYTSTKGSFSDWRNLGAKKAKGEWLLYVDADERVTPALRAEIQNLKCKMQNSDIVAYYIPRKNIFLGKEQNPDKVERLFKREKLLGWYGIIHESPKVKGRKETLNSSLIHLTHRDISSMMKKTLEWSKKEAELRYRTGHPRVVWWRILRVMLTEFYRQMFINRVYRFGTEGWIEGIFQVFSIFITYVRLWEMQREKKL